jgi:hypothetical protein
MYQQFQDARARSPLGSLTDAKGARNNEFAVAPGLWGGRPRVHGGSRVSSALACIRHAFRRPVRRRVTLALLPIVLVLAAACGSSTSKTASSTPVSPPANAHNASTSPVCADAIALQQSTERLRTLPQNRESLPAVSADVKQLKPQLDKLVQDAQGKYGPQVTRVTAGYSALTAAVSAAKAAPNTATLAGVHRSLDELISSVDSLRKAIPNGC